MKYHKINTVGTVPKSNRKIGKRGKIDTPNTYVTAHAPLLSTYVSIKSGRG